MDEELVKTVTKAICTEKCAFRGEPACHTFDGDFPPEGCQEPGCEFEARAAIQAMMEAGYTRSADTLEAERAVDEWLEKNPQYAKTPTLGRGER